ncbi:MAG: SDR family oxidoreductase [Verrucomicrobiae bacterium]|nr:SDR family oxidoreductase [Verrucomicrobiae bacterium]MCP5540626.1 SDR family oxidoreductase [Akkermansiaceae bacterium]
MSKSEETLFSGDLADRAARRRWLVTGAAGFIGSNILEILLSIGCEVTGLDNFESGFRKNLDDVRRRVGEENWARFREIEGDIRDLETCREACDTAEVVIHLAALGSVPSSISHPHHTTSANVGGFVNMLTAAKDTGVRRVVYASSCSVYGNEPTLPKREDSPLQPLSPYALSKQINEQYADMFGRCYGLETVGLRYFNVYGPRQDPGGAYAAVIPIFFDTLLKGEPVFINGDGETSRDFCHVRDVAQANLLAGTLEKPSAVNSVFNIGSGARTSLNELIEKMTVVIRTTYPDRELTPEVIHREFRSGDVTHSLSDITRAREQLGYRPSVTLDEGLSRIVPFYAGLGSA